ncbi:MAG: DUF58 domain-containing protein [Fusobacteriaceae bacterium]
MNRQEILKKIKTVEITANIIADQVFSGTYHSFFKGNGMEFSEIRRYTPGDDIKKLDWKVTARQRKAYVKEFVEERELSIFLLVDISSSNNFSDKQELIAKLIATLGFSASKNNDKVGAVFFSDKVEKYMPLKKGKKYTLTILDTYLKNIHDTSETKKTSIKSALDFFSKVVTKRSVVFLISDFFDENYERTLKIIKQKHDLILVRVLDKGFETLPKGAIFELVDSETGEEIIVENYHEDISMVQEFKSKNALTIHTDEDFVTCLLKFFKKRRGV